MATPTSLLELAQWQYDKISEEKKKAQESLIAAQKSDREAREHHGKAIGEFADLEKQAMDIRKKLSEIPTPADGVELVTALERIIIAMRKQGTKILGLDNKLYTTKALVKRATAELEGTSTMLTEAKAKLAEAEKRSKEHAALKESLSKEPLSILRDQAKDALTTPPHNESFNKAKTRIEKDIPTKLIGRTRERALLETLRQKRVLAAVTASQNLVHTELNDHFGLSGIGTKRWNEFRLIEDELALYVQQAEERYEQALALLGKVADPTKDPLTPAQVERITDADLLADREEAVAKEKERDDALAEVEAKQEALEKAILEARANDVYVDPNGDANVQTAKTDLNDAKTTLTVLETAWNAKEKERDAALIGVKAKKDAYEKAVREAKEKNSKPETDPAVTAAKTALNAAQVVLDAAEDEFKESEKGVLLSWEAAVPDPTWYQLADFEEAKRLLTELKTTDPSDLLTEKEAAETALVAALLEREKSIRTLRLLENETKERVARLEFEKGAQKQRMLSALRGDS